MFQEGADWIYGIAVVMLFGTAVLQATPEGTYQKYVRLFLGALLMLAVFSPLFSLLGLWETTRLSFEKHVLTAWLDDSSLEQEQWQAAAQKKKEAWLREPLDALAREYGFVCLDYAVQWETERDWPAQLTLWVMRERSDSAQENTASEGVSQIRPVESVAVIGQGIMTAAEDAIGTEEQSHLEGKTELNDVGSTETQVYYEPSELRRLHQALELVWNLEEDQICLYWER